VFCGFLDVYGNIVGVLRSCDWTIICIFWICFCFSVDFKIS